MIDDLQKKVVTVVAQVAKARGVGVVLEADATVYFDPSLDLSDEVVKRLDALPKG